MSYIPLKIYGGLFNSVNTTAINTSAGQANVISWSGTRASNGTTLSAANGTITINKTCQTLLVCSLSMGSNGAGSSLTWYFAFQINGTGGLFSEQYIVAPNYTADLTSVTLSALYTATYGDIVRVVVSPVTGTDPTNRPVIYLAEFQVIEIG